MIFFVPLLAAVIAFCVILFLLSSRFGQKVQDIPNERSLHDKPIPRTGGIALMTGVMAGWSLLSPFWVWWIVLPLFGLFALSLLDDVRGLPVRLRLAGHFAAALAVAAGAGVSWPWFVPVLLYVAWMTNLYNFMDGSDGLAGGMALFGFGSYGAAAWLAGDAEFALMSLAVAAAAAGFLVFNFHPARIFMGDSGSIPLGFLAAALGVSGWQTGYWPFWFPLLAFSPFAVDATFTLFRRAWCGERLSQAHRSHYYQRLVQMGWGHRNTALAEYALMLLAGISALWGIGLGIRGQAVLLLCWGAAYLGLAGLLGRSWESYRTGEGKADVA